VKRPEGVTTIPSASEKPSVQPPETPPITEVTPQPETPATTGPIDTSNWKVYRSEEYGFELKYPSEYLSLDEETPEEQYSPEIKLILDFCCLPKIQVIVRENKIHWPLEKFVKEFLAPNYKEIFENATIETIRIDENEAYRVTEKDEHSITGAIYSRIYNFLGDENIIISIQAELTKKESSEKEPAISFSEQKKILNQVLSTFKFIK
jgi:hypothetical protein